jgi:cyclophilin family peptidyl-prolyl cis-trans isomerase
VRAALAAGLAGAHDEVSLGLLYGLLREGDGRVVAAALDALRVSLGPEAGLVLVQHLAHRDPAVRMAAARGLEALQDHGHSAELSRSYRASLGDPDPEARLALVGALAQQSDHAAMETLLAAAAADPSRAVRWAAGHALVAKGEAAPVPRSDGIRPALDYVLAMASYSPLPDLPVYTPRVFLHTRRGSIEIHLNTLEAPLACESFMSLARRGFFDGLALRRPRGGGSIEGGCPRGDGTGGPGYRIPREAGLRPFGRGAVGLDAVAKDSEGSRFVISLLPDPARDGRRTLVGTIVKGMEVAEALRGGDEIDHVEVWDGR